MYKSIKFFECPTFELSELYKRVWKNDGGSIVSNRYYCELDCYRKILGIITNLNTDTQKLNAIKNLIYNQFEYYSDIQNPCPVGGKTDMSKEV